MYKCEQKTQNHIPFKISASGLFVNILKIHVVFYHIRSNEEIKRL